MSTKQETLWTLLIMQPQIVLKHCNCHKLFITCREAIASPSIGFTLRRLLTAFRRPAITPPKVNLFGWNLELCEPNVGGLAMAYFGRYPCSSDSLRGSGNLVCVFGQETTHDFKSDNFHEFCSQQRRSVSRCKLSKQNFENFIIRGCFSKTNAKIYRKCSNFGTSGRQNFAMITDCRKFSAKINIYGMSSFHFYCWNQFKVIPLACTLRTGTYVPQRFCCWWSDADHGIMRCICNHQEAPWTIYIQQMGAIRRISFTIADSNCAKNNLDYR